MRNRSLHATNAAGPPSKVDCPAALALPVTRCPGRVVESVPDTRSDLLSFGRIIARHRAAMLSAAFTSRHASEHRPGNTVANAVLDALAAHALASASEEALACRGMRRDQRSPDRTVTASSKSRIRAARLSCVIGFWIISTPGSSRPWWTMAFRE